MPTQRRREKRVEECASSRRNRQRECACARTRGRRGVGGEESERASTRTRMGERERKSACTLRSKRRALAPPFMFFPPPGPALCKLGLAGSAVCSTWGLHSGPWTFLCSVFKGFSLPCLFSSVQFSCSVVSNSLRPHKSQSARPPCPSQTPGVYSNSCPSSGWCHPAISSSVVPFSSCPQSLPASGSFPMSQLFARGGQSIGVSASVSVLPMNTQDWSPLGWTG